MTPLAPNVIFADAGHLITALGTVILVGLMAGVGIIFLIARRIKTSKPSNRALSLFAASAVTLLGITLLIFLTWARKHGL